MSFEPIQTDRLVLRPPEPGDAPHPYALSRADHGDD